MTTHVPCLTAGLPGLVLAPMEGVTDAPMRALMAEVGGFSFCVTEFLRISESIPGPRAFRAHVPELANGCRTPTGLPVQVQLLGGNPDRLAAAALAAVKVGAQAIDLNFGCPAPTVNRHDGGAALLHHPCRIFDIVRTVRQALPAAVPVSVKLRLGWDDPEAIHVNADRAAAGGASWITIHGRTRTQGYRPPVYWKPIGAVRARLGIPVVANGDIRTLGDLRRCQDETGCLHFMLGRGALADPGFIRAAAHAIGVPGAPRLEPFSGSPADWLPLVRRFIGLTGLVAGSPAFATTRIKQWLVLANVDGRIPWILPLKRARDLAELLDRFHLLATGTPAADVGKG